MSGQRLDEWLLAARDEGDADLWRSVLRQHARPADGNRLAVCEHAQAVIFDHEDAAYNARAELDEVGAPLLSVEPCLYLDGDCDHWHLVKA